MIINKKFHILHKIRNKILEVGKWTVMKSDIKAGEKS